MNAEGETIWVKQSEGEDGWMCLLDDTGMYLVEFMNLGNIFSEVDTMGHQSEYSSVN